MALRNQPYLPLYVQDFLTDEKLAECSAQSNGVYIRIMCIMHKSEEYGTISLKQKHKQTSEQIKNFALLLLRHLPYELSVIEVSLIELIDEGVLILDGDKLIQKRMVKDADISNKRSITGKKGGDKSLGKDRYFAQAKSEANTESENENDIEADIKNKSKNKPNKLDKANFKLFDLVCSLFDEKVKKENWLDVYDKLIRIDGYTEERIFEIVTEFRRDGNWWKNTGNFQTLVKLRKLNDEGMKYIDVFESKMPQKGVSNLSNTERIDANGIRTYGDGLAVVPKDAPPRPSNQHIWSKNEAKWKIQ